MNINTSKKVGSRKVAITGDERHYDTVAAVQDDDGGWRLHRPFGDDAIRVTAFVGDDLLFCLSDKTEVCLIAWRSGEEISRRQIICSSSGDVFVTSDHRFIVIYHANSILILHVNNLEAVVEGRTLQWQVDGHAGRVLNTDGYPVNRDPGGPTPLRLMGKVTEDHAGKLVFMCQDCGPEGAGRYGICRIDPMDWSVHFQSIDVTSGPWTWFSPRGRYVIARHFRSLAYDDGSRLSHLMSFGRRHRDALSDGKKRFGNALELWETDPPRLRTTAVAQMVPLTMPKDDPKRPIYEFAIDRDIDRWISLAKQSSKRPIPIEAPDWTFTDAEVQTPPELALLNDAKSFNYRIWNVIWEPDESGYWIECQVNDGRHGVAFRRVGVNGSVSPLFRFQRHMAQEHVICKSIDLDDPTQVAITADSDVVYIQRAWCNSTSSLRIISSDEDGYTKASPDRPSSAMVKRFLGKPIRHVIAVGEFSETSVVEALRQLTDDIRDRLESLVRTDVFEVEFKVGQKTLNEIAFFKRVSREKLPVAVALRNLLTTYLAVQPAVLELKQIYRQIWGPEQIGALGSAMGALLKLDPHAHDVFRNYLAQRNGEYETYSD